MSSVDIESFKADAETIFAVVYALGSKSMTYKKFNEALKSSKGYEVERLAKAKRYHCGPDFMLSIGFEFDDNDELIVCPLAERVPRVTRATTSSFPPHFAESNVGYGNNVPFPSMQSTGAAKTTSYVSKPYVEHVFDGDVTKLQPGMYVKIAGGYVYHLPSVPDFAVNDPAYTKFVQRTLIKYRKMVRELVADHERKLEIHEKIKNIYQK